ncbi:hypothetical protein [Streptomyces sp. TRM64462]|uniref:hypothetical protein n=1 Tax=Streptomyces sp. TRM64462 TaxID=2741726 RepID=UPI001C304CC4|nr:hypothetical protein [Streptomyces sp. TRM64462]
MRTKVTRWMTKAVAVLAAGAGLAVLSPAPQAYAGGSCSWAGCSQTYNYSGVYATAFRNWTCDWGTTGSWSTGCFSGSSYGLSNGAHTPNGEDWDVFRVDAGWCYLVELHAPAKKWHVRYDRRGKSAAYVKVEDWGAAYIRGQSTSTCP